MPLQERLQAKMQVAIAQQQEFDAALDLLTAL
jgi:hypothetical protein